MTKTRGEGCGARQLPVSTASMVIIHVFSEVPKGRNKRLLCRHSTDEVEWKETAEHRADGRITHSHSPPEFVCRSNQGREQKPFCFQARWNSRDGTTHGS